MLDCGDGSVRKILETKTKLLSISLILITHFHSDHVSGLTQVIETMAMDKRSEELYIFGPPGLKEYFSTVQKITSVAVNRRFAINIEELSHGEELKLGEYEITPLAMQHTVPCLGYRIEHSEFSLAYTGDTEPCDNLVSLAGNVNLLIHEATYLENERAKARETKHSTPGEAAQLATRCDVGKLLLTHVNDSHESEEEMLSEAKKIFPKTMIAHDGLELDL